MKKFAYLFSLSVTAFLLAFAVMTGCEGPAGPAGADGTNGSDGINGTDGTAVCLACHNDDTDVLAKSLQAGTSGHMTGGHFRYGDDTECSICHTHEGFLDIMESGAMEASKPYINATPPNCRTCHKIHTNFDATDFNLRFTDPVALWINDEEVDLGTSNICVSCHQIRMSEFDPVPEVGGAGIVLDDDGWGPHQAQSPTVWGTGGYEVSGNASFPAAGSTTHAEAGCVGCHMVEPGRGDQAGGHTMSMNYESRGTPREYTVSCEGCHGEDVDFDYMNIQTDVQELWDSLEVILTAKNILVDGDINASSAAPLTLTADEGGALMNLLLVEADKSTGVHNPRYIKALLKNSIQALSN